MKNSEGLRKISINAFDWKVNGFKTFIIDVLHGRELLVEPGLLVLALPDGLIFEFYTTGSHCPDYLFANNNIVNTYQVADIESAVECLQKEGANLLGEIVKLAPSCYFCHVSLEEGSVIGLIQQRSGTETIVE